MSNTRIFAGHFKFGEFRAILRGVVVKKIHNLLAQKTNTTASEKIFLTKNFVEKKIIQKYCF